MSDEDVREATLALKGMLGIGGEGSVLKKGKEGTGGSGKKSKKKRGKKSKGEAGEGKGRKSPARGGTGGKKGKRELSRNVSEGDNFAWSAFQSSPDASALPIPIFSSASSNISNSDNSNSLNNQTQTQTSKSENQISNSENSETQLPAILLGHSNSAAPLDGGNATSAASANMRTAQELEEEVLASLSDTHTPHTPQHEPQEKEEQQMEDTASGINLAALTDAGAPTETHANTAPFQSNFLAQQQYGSPYHHHPQSAHHPLMGAPPYSHLTIPVQVPHSIPPNRQIMVPSPTGYGYISVILPQGVTPGMVVPVTLPMHHPPPHQHQHHHHPQQTHHPNSPHTLTSTQPSPNDSSQNSTSWAAKVAASSPSNKSRPAPTTAQP